MTSQEHQLIMTALERVHKGQDVLAEGQAKLYERMDHLDECVDKTRSSMEDRADKMEQQLANHVEQEKSQFEEVIALIKSAVPDGNFRGHHDYHLAEMKKWQFWHKIKSSVVGKVLEVGTIAVLGWVVLTLWGGFKIVVTQ